MSRDEIKAITLEVLAKYAKNKAAMAQATEETEIRDDLKIKSARLVDVVLDLETKLDIEVDPEDMDQMFTVGEAIEILGKYLSRS